MEYSDREKDFTRQVKENAVRYGFDLVGIVSAEALDAVPSHYIGHRDYKTWTRKTVDYMEDARSLIILGTPIWDNLFDLVIKVRGRHEYPDEWRGRLYARRLTRFLGRHGYKSELEPDLLSKKRMGQLAGLGNFGKNSLLITPEYGPWVRLRSVLTDAVLVPDKPFTGDLCSACEECIKACPVGALTPYRVDPDTCLLGIEMERRLSDDYRDLYLKHSPSVTENTWIMCQTCQRACPIGSDRRNQKYGR